jgi:hypothetical protein
MTYVKGITSYELKYKHVMDHFDSVFSGHSHDERERRRGALHMALGLGLDRDSNQPHSQHEGVIQADEFHAAVDGLVKSKLISPEEAAKLRQVAEKPLND